MIKYLQTLCLVIFVVCVTLLTGSGLHYLWVKSDYRVTEARFRQANSREVKFTGTPFTLEGGKNYRLVFGPEGDLSHVEAVGVLTNWESHQCVFFEIAK